MFCFTLPIFVFFPASVHFIWTSYRGALLQQTQGPFLRRSPGLPCRRDSAVADGCPSSDRETLPEGNKDELESWSVTEAGHTYQEYICFYLTVMLFIFLEILTVEMSVLCWVFHSELNSNSSLMEELFSFSRYTHQPINTKGVRAWCSHITCISNFNTILK